MKHDKMLEYGITKLNPGLILTYQTASSVEVHHRSRGAEGGHVGEQRGDGVEQGCGST